MSNSEVFLPLTYFDQLLRNKGYCSGMEMQVLKQIVPDGRPFIIICRRERGGEIVDIRFSPSMRGANRIKDNFLKKTSGFVTVFDSNTKSTSSIPDSRGIFKYFGYTHFTISSENLLIKRGVYRTHPDARFPVKGAFMVTGFHYNDVFGHIEYNLVKSHTTFYIHYQNIVDLIKAGWLEVVGVKEASSDPSVNYIPRFDEYQGEILAPTIQAAPRRVMQAFLDDIDGRGIKPRGAWF